MIVNGFKFVVNIFIFFDIFDLFVYNWFFFGVYVGVGFNVVILVFNVDVVVIFFVNGIGCDVLV